MRNLVLIGLLSLSAVACSKSGSGCNPNVEVVVDSSSKVRAENLKSENVVVVPADAKSQRISQQSKYVFNDGTEYKFHTSDEDGDESEDSASVFDFNTMRVKSDDLDVSFTRDYSKGEGWYVLDEQALKAEMASDLSGNEDVKICSLDTFKVNFRVNGDAIESNIHSKMKVQILNQEVLGYLKEQATHP